MHKCKINSIWSSALLIIACLTGCGREQGALSPTLTSISPNAVVQGQAVNVMLTGTDFATGATDNVSGALVSVGNMTVVSATQNTATFTVSGAAMLGARNVTVTTLGMTTNSVPFTIVPPLVLSSTSPASGAANVSSNSNVTATFNQAMTCSTLTAATFTVTVAGVPVAGSVTCAGAIATFTPTNNLASNATYSATITTGALGLAGNGLPASFVWSFSTVASPQVIFTVPSNGATGVPTNQIITATFSQPMNPVTLNSPATNFTVMGPAGVAVPGTVTYVAAGSTALFTPTAPLAASTLYTATITTGVQSTAGNPLLNNFVWSFTTGVGPNTIKPTVISTIPVNGAVGVPTNQAVSAIFSKPMNPATINAATFTLTTGGNPVAGTVTYAAIAQTAIFTPTANLLPGTLYTATITVGAQDLTGNPLGPGSVPNPWTFTTGAGPSVTKPAIVSTNPANASVNVALNATVNATFSKAMNPLTITTTTFQLVGPGGAVIAGTIAYDPVNFIATFTPTIPLVASTTYVADFTTGATDLAGDPLGPGAVPNPWSFTTGAAVVPPGIVLGAAFTFGSFGGGAGVTNQGIFTVINGDIGTTAASTLITGFHDTAGCSYTETGSNMGTVNGEIYTASPAPTVGPAACSTTEGNAATFLIASNAARDALIAYNQLAAMPGGPDPGAGQLGGLVLAPGTYTAASGSFQITGTDLTLDAQGNPNAMWVFQMATSLTVGAAGAPRSVILVNGAQAQNVYWQVGSAATINAAGGGTMVGTIIAKAGVTFSTAGNAAVTTLNGRALGLNASVTMVNTVVNVP